MVKVNPTQWQPVGGQSASPPRQAVKLNPSSWEVPGKSAQPLENTVQVAVNPSAWNPISGVQAPRIIRTFEGVNGLDPFSIKDSQATRSNNFSTGKYPSLAVRNGNSYWEGPFSAPIEGLAAYNLTDIYMELHVISGGTWYVLRRTNSWEVLKTGMPTGFRWNFVSFHGSYSSPNLFASNGQGYLYKYDGASVVTSLLTPNPALGVTSHDNRLYFAVRDVVHFSALNKPEDLTTVNDSGQITVETQDSSKITGLVSGSQRLTVFKRNSIHELFGTSPTNFTLKKVAENVGTPNGDTCQVIDGTIYFLGNDSIYRYSGGNLPTSDFAIPIKNIIATINWSYISVATSWQSGRKYYLAVPTGNYSTPNLVLEYDIDLDVWNTLSYVAQWVTSNPTIYNGITYLGMINGKIYVLDGKSQWDYTNSVEFEWVSKPFTFDSISAKVRWYKVWLVADIPTGASLTVWVSGKAVGEDWVQIQAFTPTTDMLQKEINIPTNLFVDSHCVRLRLTGVGQVVIHEMALQERVFPMGIGGN